MEHHNCHEHHHAETNHLEHYSEIGDFNLLLNLILIALVGSFTHCALMCGPIAGLLSASKMLGLQGKALNNWARIKASLNFEYILGKALTYSIITLLVFSVKGELKNTPAFKYVGFVVLVLTAFSFITAAVWNFNLPIFKKSKFSKLTSKVIENLIKQPILKKWPKLISEIFRGMALGLIPCGFVYSSIIIAVTFSSNALIASSSMFIFGLATAPSLIIASILGAGATFKVSKLAKIILLILCLINAALLISYALKLL